MHTEVRNWRFVSSKDDANNVLFDTNDCPVLIEKSNLMYFDEDLKIDYSDAVNSFQFNKKLNKLLTEGCHLFLN